VYGSGGVGSTATGQIFKDTVCVPANECIALKMHDGFGDGICCNYGQGSYSFTYNGVLAASGGQYQHDAVHYVGCPAGSFCDTSIVVSTGTHSTQFEDTWYSFTPTQNGMYTISACNACSTGIWVYNTCPDSINDTQAGADLYSVSGCSSGSGALLTTAMVAGTKYYIRIGDYMDDCSGTFMWDLTYTGGIVGCMNPTACNYNPLATISDTCYFAPNPICGGPDLRIDENLIKTSLHLDSLTNTSACTIQEGCLVGYGKRYILRFSTRIDNIGNMDYFIGQTPASTTAGSTQFIWDPCHNHWHYVGYAEYLLFDSQGNQLQAGFKNGFCVLDLYCQGGGTAKFSCSNMGITAGCSDEYSSGLSCQWLDITNVDTGNYVMVVRVNWDQSPDVLGNYETTYANNWAQVCIRVDKNLAGVPIVTQIPNCAAYEDCAGTPFGNAQMDCNGVCAGTALKGDLNTDVLRNLTDVGLYFSASLSQALNSTLCNDLNDDGSINIIDAALSLDCAIKGTAYTPPIGGVENHCDFPVTIVDIMDTVQVNILGSGPNYVDLSMYNPTVKVNGWQLKVSGIQIDSVKSIVPALNYSTTLDFNASNNMIASLSNDEKLINKSVVDSPLVRIYGAFTQSVICIDSIVGIVNERYEPVITQKGNCILLSSTYKPDFERLKLVPNPTKDFTFVQFSNFKNASYQVEVVDLQGKVVKTAQAFGNEYKLEKGNLAAGIYVVQITQGEYIWREKLMITP